MDLKDPFMLAMVAIASGVAVWFFGHYDANFTQAVSVSLGVATTILCVLVATSFRVTTLNPLYFSAVMMCVVGIAIGISANSLLTGIISGVIFGIVFFVLCIIL